MAIEIFNIAVAQCFAGMSPPFKAASLLLIKIGFNLRLFLQGSFPVFCIHIKLDSELCFPPEIKSCLSYPSSCIMLSTAGRIWCSM